MEKEISDQMANGNFILLPKSSIPREATVLNSMVPGPVNVAFWQHLLHIFDRFSVFVAFLATFSESETRENLNVAFLATFLNKHFLFSQ